MGCARYKNIKKRDQMKDTKTLVNVKLIAHTNKDPLDLTSHAAKVCYQSVEPEWGKRMDVEGILFKTGHHTTLQHFFVTFYIEGISVGDITLGMHLGSAFDNSDQRSGRYCAKMFLDPDYIKIQKYIGKYCPDVKEDKLKQVMKYIEDGVEVYHNNVQKAEEIAKRFPNEG